MEQVEITYDKAITAQTKLRDTDTLGQPNRTGFDKFTGDAALAIYFLSEDIREAFSAYDKRRRKLLEELRELVKPEGSTNPTGQRQKSPRQKQIEQELDDLAGKTETVTLRHGFLKIDEVKQHLSKSEIRAIDFAIDFDLAGDTTPPDNGQDPAPEKTAEPPQS